VKGSRAVWKRLIEALRPDLDHYRKLPRQARVTGVGTEAGAKVVDLTILLNDGSVDGTEPALRRVPLDTCGLVPRVGAVVTVSYDRGDPGAPVVTGIRDLGRANLQEFSFEIGEDRLFALDPEGKALAHITEWEWEQK